MEEYNIKEREKKINDKSKCQIEYYSGKWDMEKNFFDLKDNILGDFIYNKSVFIYV